MDAREFGQQLHEAEGRLERLKALYEQWFQGVERLEPAVPRKDIERRLQQLRKAVPRNTTLRFRFQQLQQRYTTYSVYWARIARQIEEGTYRRDLLQARKQRQQARSRREQTRQGGREDDSMEAIDLGELLIEDDDDDDIPTLPPPKK
ncbi:MAG: hypothetical protein H6714_00780 [Myxococcales bacterium]|nr:hypothetical protein [Myxococcales bacterium]